jgi:O-antigen/teichoic acid export membrane protein
MGNDQHNKKIKNNVIYGLSGQIVGIFLGIILPKMILMYYGSELNGLLSSITNIYAYMAIVEAGVAAASCQSLYQAIGNNDRNDINAILSATNRYYYRTGTVYLALICVFSVCYPLFVQTSIPNKTIRQIIFLNGIGNVFNYFFYGKYLILLKADGKNYVRVIFETLTNALKQITKIVLIVLGYNVVFVQLVALGANLVQMICVKHYIKKNYAWVDLKAKPNNDALSQNKNAIIHEIHYLITANTDVVLLTFFTDLKLVSIYSLYAMLMGMIDRVLRVVRESLEFRVAHYFHTDREAFLKFFKTYEVYYITAAFSLFTIATYFCVPFIVVYTKGVTDTEYANTILPYLFAIVGLLNASRYPFDALVYIAGHFKQTQNSAMVESTANLVISILLVRTYGIVGVLFGTIIASFFRINYQILYVNRKIARRDSIKTYRCIGINVLLYTVVLSLSQFLPLEITSIWKIIVLCVPYSVGVIAIYMIIISLIDKEAFACVRDVIRKKA